MNLFIPVSVGEVFDKLSILHLKLWYIKDPEKRSMVVKEIDNLEKSLGTDLADSYVGDANYCELFKVNKLIWESIELSNTWNFTSAANQADLLYRESVYRGLNVLNNQRFQAKKRINESFDSEVREVKSHI